MNTAAIERGIDAAVRQAVKLGQDEKVNGGEPREATEIAIRYASGILLTTIEHELNEAVEEAIKCACARWTDAEDPGLVRPPGALSPLASLWIAGAFTALRLVGERLALTPTLVVTDDPDPVDLHDYLRGEVCRLMDAAASQPVLSDVSGGAHNGPLTSHEKLSRLIYEGITSGDDNPSRIARNIAHSIMRIVRDAGAVEHPAKDEAKEGAVLANEPRPPITEHEKLDLYRQWFDAVQDLHPASLDHRDYLLAKELRDRLGMRVPHSILRGIEAASRGDVDP